MKMKMKMKGKVILGHLEKLSKALRASVNGKVLLENHLLIVFGTCIGVFKGRSCGGCAVLTRQDRQDSQKKLSVRLNQEGPCTCLPCPTRGGGVLLALWPEAWSQFLGCLLASTQTQIEKSSEFDGLELSHYDNQRLHHNDDKMVSFALSNYST